MRPVILEMHDAELETIATINDIMRKHNLPCALYEPILAKAYRQVQEGKNQEILALKNKEERDNDSNQTDNS